MITVYPQPNLEVTTQENEWWIAYDRVTNKIVFDQRKSAGFVPGLYTLVVADTKEELDQYIVENQLTCPDFTQNSILLNIL